MHSGRRIAAVCHRRRAAPAGQAELLGEKAGLCGQDAAASGAGQLYARHFKDADHRDRHGPPEHGVTAEDVSLLEEPWLLDGGTASGDRSDWYHGLRHSKSILVWESVSTLGTWSR